MAEESFYELTHEELRAFIRNSHEKNYLLIDVRQPLEYTQGHIPGARLLPLGELESNLFDLPGNKDLVFYCRSGGRSKAAASLAFEAEVTEKKVYNMVGGIMAWNDKTLPDYPRVQLFQPDQDPVRNLTMAMELEKGAMRFYHLLIEKIDTEGILPVIRKLAAAETDHAKAIYHYLKQMSRTLPPFEEMFEALKGDILEGGMTLDTALQRMDALKENMCLNGLELALLMEHSAYDLYKNVAAITQDDSLKGTLLTIAQAEKKHIRLLAQSFDSCF